MRVTVVPFLFLIAFRVISEQATVGCVFLAASRFWIALSVVGESFTVVCIFFFSFFFYIWNGMGGEV